MRASCEYYAITVWSLRNRQVPPNIQWLQTRDTATLTLGYNESLTSNGCGSDIGEAVSAQYDA